MYFGYLQASEGSWGAPWQSKGRPKRLPGRAQRLYTEEGGNIKQAVRRRQRQVPGAHPDCTWNTGCLRRKGMSSEFHVTMRIAPLQKS